MVFCVFCRLCFLLLEVLVVVNWLCVCVFLFNVSLSGVGSNVRS